VGKPDERCIHHRLLGAAGAPAVVELERHTPDRHAGWFDAASPGIAAPPSAVTHLDVELARTWNERAADASRWRLPPRSFTQAAVPRPLGAKKGRFGSLFGDTVHLAIGLALAAAQGAEDAVRSAAARTALTAHVAEAVEDVVRALATLRALGVSAGQGGYRIEYPVAGVAPGGDLVAGYIDLVVERADGIFVIDFKTDAPPEADGLILEKYLDQARGYAGVLAQALRTGPILAGLLFTADGGIRWLSSGDHAPPSPQPHIASPSRGWAPRSP
jgi:ATP-dependent helicase/nuclease subunit A